MKKNTVKTASAILGFVAFFSAAPAFAQIEYAKDLGIYPQCSGCHATTDDSSGNGGNSRNRLRGSVWDRCTAPQVLNTTKHLCEIPLATPSCTNGQILNAAKTACVASPAPIVTPDPIITPEPVTPAKTNTNPVLNAITPQQDAKVGELLKIPLSVKDAEQDEFKMLASVAGVKFSKVYTDEKTLLPTIDFLLTPTIKQVNTVLAFTFQAKETKTTLKLMSKKVSVKIRVWAAGDRDAASITKFNVSTSAFKSGKLNMTGNIIFNNLLTTIERNAFIAKKLDLTISDKNGAFVGATPLTLDAKGNWSAAILATSVPCDIILQYEGQNAARTVVGCTKSTATIAAPVTVANNSFGDDEENDGHDDDHNEHENDKHKRDD